MVQPPQEPTPQWRRFARIGPSSKDIRTRARKIESATMRHAHRFIVRRWDNAREVRRHIVGWLLLIGLLIGGTVVQAGWYMDAYTTEAPAAGGTYAEGVLGKLDTMNPLFATTNSEQSASRLVFSSLLRYDTGNTLKGDLATGWKSDDGGKTYRITMKEDLSWHDGAPLTAEDVLFTIDLMRDPEVNASRSLQEIWSQVDVEKVDDRTLQFTLPGKFAPFPHALTFGVVPKHILEKMEPQRLRESDFGRKPVGSGPFKFSDIQVISPEESRLMVQMSANPQYHDGAPRLSRIQIYTYGDRELLKQGYLSGEVNAAIGLSSAELQEVSQARPLSNVSRAGLHNGMFALFNTRDDVLKEQKVRTALRRAVNQPDIIKSLGRNALPLSGPLLSSQYDPTDVTVQPASDKVAAEKALDQAGWRKGDDGLRRKSGKLLSLNVIAPREGDYPKVAEQISQQWRAVGVEVKTELMDPDTFIQNVLRPRAYDVLIYELSLGADPDSYAYWHSSQVGSSGTNLSNYESELVDETLSSARSVEDPKLRAAKYGTFVQEWVDDAPAVALYQPTIHYISTRNTSSVPDKGNLVSSASRYHSVLYWSVGRETVMKTP